MLKKKKVLALIPARGGSKGIKNKNIRIFGGKPLIAHTIEAALLSSYIDLVLVSTDSQEIADVALKYGAAVPFLRPKSMARDTSSVIEAVIHALAELRKRDDKYDILVLLQPTSPLRRSQDIDGALKHFFKCGEKDLLSVSEVEKHPHFFRSLGRDFSLRKLLPGSGGLRRQDLGKCYKIDGAIYINAVHRIKPQTVFNENEIGYTLPRHRAHDIDEEIDFLLAESLNRFVAND